MGRFLNRQGREVRQGGIVFCILHFSYFAFLAVKIFPMEKGLAAPLRRTWKSVRLAYAKGLEAPFSM
jgi:hypothetical protein